MLTHIYGILKNGIDEPSGRAEIKTQTENGLEDTAGVRGSWDEVRE